MTEEEITKQYFKGLTRKEYIERAQEIIKRNKNDEITIRMIADEIGCSSAALYRYFKSKDELMYFVNLKTLENYIKRLNIAQKNWKGIWDCYVGVWDCYCREAFANPKVFDQLFFQNSNVMLKDSMSEYYKMFPSNFEAANDIFQNMLSTPDFLGRDYLMCQKCANAGVLSKENTGRLNQAVCMLYKGYFKTILDEGVEKYGIDSWTRRCIADIDMIVFALADDLQGYSGYYEANAPSTL